MTKYHGDAGDLVAREASRLRAKLLKIRQYFKTLKSEHVERFGPGGSHFISKARVCKQAADRIEAQDAAREARRVQP